MRRTAVVRPRCEPRRPRRQANAGVTAGQLISSTSTAAMRIAAYHHTNDEMLSSGSFALALHPGALDVLRDQLGRSYAVACCERLVDGAMVTDRLPQELPRRRAREQRPGVPVPVDGTHDGPPHLVP